MQEKKILENLILNPNLWDWFIGFCLSHCFVIKMKVSIPPLIRRKVNAFSSTNNDIILSIYHSSFFQISCNWCSICGLAKINLYLRMKFLDYMTGSLLFGLKCVVPKATEHWTTDHTIDILPHSGFILDSQLGWESGKFQLARWSLEVVL